MIGLLRLSNVDRVGSHCRLTVRNLMRRLILSVLAVVVLLGRLSSQTQEPTLSFALRGTYTSTSKVFINPDSPSGDLRGQYNSIDNIYGAGAELRWRVHGNSFAISLATEYLSKISSQSQLVGFTTPPQRLPVEEGFWLIPVELGLQVFIPLGSDRVQFTMGGGVGAYIGSRFLKIAGVEAVERRTPVHYGIHVETDFDYRIRPGLFVRAEMRFRDPEFTTESEFTQPATKSGGVLVLFPSVPFRARINVNGMNFGIGVGIEMF
jgi:hypothetical protein